MCCYSNTPLCIAAVRHRCPEGSHYWPCLFNPCYFSFCPNFPDARCEADYCDGCNARWYVGKTEVTNVCYHGKQKHAHSIQLT